MGIKLTTETTKLLILISMLTNVFLIIFFNTTEGEEFFRNSHKKILDLNFNVKILLILMLDFN